jgi:DNA processing protein
LLARRATVVSEVEPATTAFRGCFPRRNRLIAALSKVVVVVEADHKSGAINTATHALDLNGTVAAVPGRIDVAQSNGTNQLIFDGAQIVRSPADLLALAGVTVRHQQVSRLADSSVSADPSPDEREGEGFAEFARRMLDDDLARSR